jgi:hypothetical protein
MPWPPNYKKFLFFFEFEKMDLLLISLFFISLFFYIQKNVMLIEYRA